MSLLDTIRSLATLSRMGLQEGRDEKLALDIESILSYVSEVRMASEEAPLAELSVLHNVMREDDSPTPSNTHSDVLLAAAPTREGRYVKVKKIL